MRAVAKFWRIPLLLYFSLTCGWAHPVIDRYCLDCHDKTAGEPKGGIDLSEPTAYAKIFRAIDHGEMPPAGEKQPSRAEFRQMRDWLELQTRPSALGEIRDPGKPVLRRLTRLEYNNTLRDLLELDTDVFMFAERLNYSREYFDPTAERMPDKLHIPAREYGLANPCLFPDISVPADNKAEHGFMNRGDLLNLSPLQLEKYLEVTSAIVEHVNLEGEPLVEFMRSAFRRPPTEEEVELYSSLERKEAIRAILTSPKFLYLIEPYQPGRAVRQANSYEIASRLSYFLWSSMPDQQLLKAAKNGELGDNNNIERHAMRMIRAPKVKEFTESFVMQWLQLNKLLGSQPDRKRFKSYYIGAEGKRTLTQDLLLEPILFFETILVEDRSILELVDSDWIYGNSLTFDLYQLPTSEIGSTSNWARVQLPDKRRGGILTSGAVLTLTSTPMRTSPVYRGNWIAEVILNRPPPPPPAAVDELGADDKFFNQQGLTLRDMLREHRENPNCAGCHDGIDPLGFAFEHYNAIGRWRDGYNIELGIDARGALGRSEFEGAVEFKTALLSERELFVRGFVKHLLSYALGRELGVADAATVDEIVLAAEKGDFRFSSILRAIVTSYPFVNIRNVDPRH